MRIACIASSRIPSRTANSIQVMKVCQALVELGHDVRLWVPGKAPAEAWEALAEHYGLRRRVAVEWLGYIPPLRRYDFCLRALRRARAWRPDLYYVWLLPAAALASRRGLPTLLEVHDRPTGRLGPRWLGMFMRGPGARRLLTVSEALRQWLEEQYRTPLRPPYAVVAPNGVDLERYADLPSPAEARRQLGLPERFTAGYTGHLYPGRGIGLLLDLARRNRDLSFVWAGGEPEAVRLWESRLRQASIENVTQLGFVPNERLPLIQAACDVLLMPYERRIAGSGGGDSAGSASPMKAFEYLAAGRAILSSDLPVLREVLNEANAVLLPPEDIETWDQALKALASDEARRQALAARARADAARYSWTGREQQALQGLEGSNGG
ncbi:MAG: glycosyltransferase [Chloroflexota bacterium]